MTKKDFELIARVIRLSKRRFDAYNETAIEIHEFAKEMAYHLSATNPRFDRERFLAACGVQS